MVKDVDCDNFSVVLLVAARFLLAILAPVIFFSVEGGIGNLSAYMPLVPWENEHVLQYWSFFNGELWETIVH